MKKILTLTLILFVKLISAQSFTQGDLTVYIDVSFNHDSTQCKSFGFTTYLINVQNSAIGDTLKIKDAFDNILIFSEINTTGQNPWILNVPCFNCVSEVPDILASQGVSFDGPPKKFICGPDTIPFAFSNQVFTVTNRCSYEAISGRIYIDNNNNCNYDVVDGTLSSFYSLDVQGNYNGNFNNFYAYSSLTNGQYSIYLQ